MKNTIKILILGSILALTGCAGYDEVDNDSCPGTVGMTYYAGEPWHHDVHFIDYSHHNRYQANHGFSHGERGHH